MVCVAVGTKTKVSRKMIDLTGPLPEWLFIEEIAALCRTNTGTVREWIKKGKLASSRPGRRRMVRRDELERFLEPSKRVAAAPASEAAAAPASRSGAWQLSGRARNALGNALQLGREEMIRTPLEHLRAAVERKAREDAALGRWPDVSPFRWLLRQPNMGKVSAEEVCRVLQIEKTARHCPTCTCL